MQRRIRHTLDELGVAPPVLPAADAYETESEFVVELEAPGFDEQDLDIEVFDHTLVVKGERAEEKAGAERSFWLRERLENTFERRFELPPEADTTKASASYAKGVLAVHVPKTAATKPRKVAIEK